MGGNRGVLNVCTPNLQEKETLLAEGRAEFIHDDHGNGCPEVLATYARRPKPPKNALHA